MKPRNRVFFTTSRWKSVTYSGKPLEVRSAQADAKMCQKGCLRNISFFGLKCIYE